MPNPVEGPAIALLIAVAMSVPTHAHAQWEIEESHTTASLRGIHNVGGGVAWASGSNGTVLRTEDGGYLWQTCSIPLAGTKDSAEKLDFRGIQAFDENTAIVMSSGPGDQSRLYKTTDGCQTWKLLFTNPDKDGFWDRMQFSSRKTGILIGDPVLGQAMPGSQRVASVTAGFPIFELTNGGTSWHRSIQEASGESEMIFAASNSSLTALLSLGPNGSFTSKMLFVTGGPRPSLHSIEYAGESMPLKCAGMCLHSSRTTLNLASGQSGGGFSVASIPTADTLHIVIVGGDYKLPDSQSGTAVSCTDNTTTKTPNLPTDYECALAQTLPHGYRSAVAYDEKTKSWITVGPNGTDISTDDGRNWRPLKPTAQDDKDADKNWNALSLPFVVGPKGRIGRLRTNALPPPPAKSKP